MDAATVAGVRLGSAPDTVLGTGTQTARAVIDEGRIGRPIAATAVMATPGPESWHPNPDFYFLPGGGPLMDMGPYYISALVHLLGPVTAVVGSASRLRSERVIGSGPRAGERIPVEVDTHVSGILEHASGALSTLTTSFDSVEEQRGADRDPRRDRLVVGSRPEHVLRRRLVLPDRIDASGSSSATRAGYVDAARGIGLLDMLAAPTRCGRAGLRPSRAAHARGHDRRPRVGPHRRARDARDDGRTAAARAARQLVRPDRPLGLRVFPGRGAIWRSLRAVGRLSGCRPSTMCARSRWAFPETIEKVDGHRGGASWRTPRRPVRLGTRAEQGRPRCARALERTWPEGPGRRRADGRARRQGGAARVVPGRRSSRSRTSTGTRPCSSAST